MQANFSSSWERSAQVDASGLGQVFGSLGQALFQGLGQAQARASPGSAVPGDRDRDRRSDIDQIFQGLSQVVAPLGEALGQALGEGLSEAAAQMATAAAEESGPPPTATDTLTSLPKVRVTAYDIEQNQSTSCPVCLEEFAIGDEAMRLPCGHLFHEGCIKEWLGKHNQCPCCRYELPTDSARFERGRQARMSERRPRLRLADLSAKKVQELRHLAEHLGVDVKGCLEKRELVDCIVTSGRVEVIPEAPATGERPAAPPAPAPHAPAAAPSPRRLAAMSVRELKAEMEQAGVDSQGCLEKGELIERLLLSGQAPSQGEHEAEPAEPDGAAAEPAPAP